MSIGVFIFLDNCAQLCTKKTAPVKEPFYYFKSGVTYFATTKRFTILVFSVVIFTK